jgi:hypothetical protein
MVMPMLDHSFPASSLRFVVRSAPVEKAANQDLELR